MLFGLNRRPPKKEKVTLEVTGPYGTGGDEPALQELLCDPLVQQLARSDKILPNELSDNVEMMRRKLRQKRTQH